MRPDPLGRADSAVFRRPLTGASAHSAKDSPQRGGVHVRMQRTVEHLDGLAVKVAITLAPEDVQAAFTEVFNSVKDNVELPGFRKGKAPRKLVEAQIEKRFGREWYLGNALEKAIEKAVNEVLREEAIEPYTMPHVHPANLMEEYKDGEPLSFTAEFSKRPELPEFVYRGIAVRIPRRTLSEKDVDLSLENIRVRLGEATPIEDRAAEPGDWATVRMQAWHPDVDTNRQPLFDNELDVQIRGGERTIAFLDDHLIGLKPGEEAEAHELIPADFVQPPFPEDTMLKLKVQLQKLETRVLPELTDDLIKEKLGVYESIEAVRQGIQEQLQQHLETSRRTDLSDAIQTHLLTTVAFELPQVAVERRYNEIRNQTLYQAKTEGRDLEAQWAENPEMKEQFENSFWEAAERSTRLDFIADAVARRERLQVTNDELAQAVMGMAQQSGLSQEDTEKLFKDRQFLEGIFTRLIRSKAWWIMMSESEVEEVAVAPASAAESSGGLAAALMQVAQETAEQLEALTDTPAEEKSVS